MHSALYLPKPSAQLLPPYLNPDPNPLTGAAFASSPLYAKSADRRIICGRSVGACAKTVFHVGVRQIRLQVEHLQTFCWYLRRDRVSRECTPNPPLTGAVFAGTPLVFAPKAVCHVGVRQICRQLQCFMCVYAKSAESAAFGVRANSMFDKVVREIRWKARHLQTRRWQDKFQVFHVGVRQIRWQVRHLQTLRWYLRQGSVSRERTPNALTGAAFADVRWHVPRQSVSRRCTPDLSTSEAFDGTSLAFAPTQCFS